MPFGSFRQTPEQGQALARITGWTRERFMLDADAPVSVTQIACSVPGCPPLETVVAFWTGDDALRHHFKVFKPMTAVGPRRPAVRLAEEVARRAGGRGLRLLLSVATAAR